MQVTLVPAGWWRRNARSRTNEKRAMKVLRSYGESNGMQWIALRYFNVAGVASAANLGEDPENTTRVIPKALNAVLGLGRPFGLTKWREQWAGPYRRSRWLRPLATPRRLWRTRGRRSGCRAGSRFSPIFETSSNRLCRGIGIIVRALSRAEP